MHIEKNRLNLIHSDIVVNVLHANIMLNVLHQFKFSIASEKLSSVEAQINNLNKNYQDLEHETSKFSEVYTKSL